MHWWREVVFTTGSVACPSKSSTTLGYILYCSSALFLECLVWFQGDVVCKVTDLVVTNGRLGCAIRRRFWTCGRSATAIIAGLSFYIEGIEPRIVEIARDEHFVPLAKALKEMHS